MSSMSSWVGDRIRFNPEATVEEIAGIGRHPRFDAVIDDKEMEEFT